MCACASVGTDDCNLHNGLTSHTDGGRARADRQIRSRAKKQQQPKKGARTRHVQRSSRVLNESAARFYNVAMTLGCAQEYSTKSSTVVSREKNSLKKS